MRILEVVFFTSLGGIENYTRDLFTELEDRGHQLVVVTAGEQLPGLAKPGRALHFLPELASLDHGGDHVAARLNDVICRERPDVAHVHHPSGRVAALITRALPTVYFAHAYNAFCPGGARLFQRTDSICNLSGVPDPRCLINAFLQRCNTRRPLLLWNTYRNTKATLASLQMADAIVCDSEYIRGQHIVNGLPTERIHVLPSPVPVPAHSGAKLAASERIVLFVGRIVPEKGLDYLISAMAKVMTTCRLVVVGRGYDLARQRALVAHLRLGGRVSFRGALDRGAVQDLYARAAVLVVPSVWPEPFGMVGPEAMAYGVPVVAFRVGGIPEWLLDGEVGFLVDPRDVDGLARRIGILLDDPVLAQRLGARGKQIVEERFTLRRHVDGLLQVFARAIDARRRMPVPAASG